MKDPLLLIAMYRADKVAKDLKKVSRSLDLLNKKIDRSKKKYGW
jgi:hypothetical protein